jgi:hypothetical protein
MGEICDRMRVFAGKLNCLGMDLRERGGHHPIGNGNKKGNLEIIKKQRASHNARLFEF